MRINTNLMALNTHRQLSVNTSSVAKSTEKLSSGLRINRAGDDAAGLAISEKMRAQIKGLNMASKNSQDAISLVQTAEGALTETHSILQRMRELAVQSSSDTNESSVDRAALQEEFSALRSEINDIASETSFNNQKLLDGSFGLDILATSTVYSVGVSSVSVDGGRTDEVFTITDATGAGGFEIASSDGTRSFTSTLTGSVDGAQTLTWQEDGVSISIETNAAFSAQELDGLTIVMGDTAEAKIQTGANANETLALSISAMSSSALSINTATIANGTAAESAITSVNSAIDQVSTQRAKLGAVQNRLEHKIKNLDASSENLAAAESRIRDLDMASEMTKFTSSNILVQAATAMLAQANAAPQNVLQLLQ